MFFCCLFDLETGTPTTLTNTSTHPFQRSSVFMTLDTAISKSSWVTCCRRSRRANIPACRRIFLQQVEHQCFLGFIPCVARVQNSWCFPLRLGANRLALGSTGAVHLRGDLLEINAAPLRIRMVIKIRSLTRHGWIASQETRLTTKKEAAVFLLVSLQCWYKRICDKAHEVHLPWVDLQDFPASSGRDVDVSLWWS